MDEETINCLPKHFITNRNDMDIENIETNISGNVNYYMDGYMNNSENNNNNNNNNNSNNNETSDISNNLINQYNTINVPYIVANKDMHYIKMMQLRQDVLNKKIGSQAYKKYLSAAIWNYVTTFINFAITLLTALSTGQAASANILTQQQSVIVLFVTFILTTTNSFFKLNIKMNLNFESAKKYYQFGAEFEKIYYQNIYNKTDVFDKIYKYQTLHDEINEYIMTETIEHQNYITECIYYLLANNSIAMKINSEKYSKWIPCSERHIELDGFTDSDFNVKNGLKSVFAPLNLMGTTGKKENTKIIFENTEMNTNANIPTNALVPTDNTLTRSSSVYNTL